MKRVWMNVKNRIGFSVAELVVIVAVLTIMGVILIPGVLNWVDKTKEKDLAVVGRTVMLASKSAASECYGSDPAKPITRDCILAYFDAADGTQKMPDGGMAMVEYKDYKVVKVAYTDGEGTAVWENNTWVVSLGNTVPAAPASPPESDPGNGSVLLR